MRENVDLGWYQLPKGSLGGNYIKYMGTVDGVASGRNPSGVADDTPHRPHWDIQGCYITQIDGDPCVYTKHMIFPKPDVDLPSGQLCLDRHDSHRYAGP